MYLGWYRDFFQLVVYRSRQRTKANICESVLCYRGNYVEAHTQRGQDDVGHEQEDPLCEESADGRVEPHEPVGDDPEQRGQHHVEGDLGQGGGNPVRVVRVRACASKVCAFARAHCRCECVAPVCTGACAERDVCESTWTRCV